MDNETVFKESRCAHSPSRNYKQIMVFFDFLIHLPELYQIKDNKAMCAKCDACIYPPEAYYNGTQTKCFFFTLTIPFFIYLMVWDFQRTTSHDELSASIILFCIVLLLPPILDRIVSSIILSTHTWQSLATSANADSFTAVSNKCTVQRQRRHIVANTYRLIVLFLLLDFHLGILLLSICLIELVVSVVRKKVGNVLFFIPSLVYSLFSIFFSQDCGNVMEIIDVPVLIFCIIILTYVGINE